MLRAEIDSNGRLHVVLPGKNADILKLGVDYLAKETSQPADLQLREPALALVQATLTAAQSADTLATQNEAQRAVSAVDYGQALDEAKGCLKQDIFDQLLGQHSKNRAYLEEYGLDTKVGARGQALVAKPTNDKGWIKFLVKYVEQQTALPEAERIVDPPLTRMSQLATIVTGKLQTRTSGAAQREIGVAHRSAAVTRLLDLLQTAALVLCATRFDGCVVEDLQLWGFKVVDKTNVPAEEPAPAAAA